MRVFLSIKHQEDQSNREQIELILSAIESAGFSTQCMVRDAEKWGQVKIHPAELMRKTFDDIDSCDVLAAELSEKGVGVGIEAGYAAARGMMVVTIAKTGADISATLRGISRHVYFYYDPEELKDYFSGLSAQMTPPRSGFPRTRE